MTAPAESPARRCVLGCADRTHTNVWPRPPRPRADGLLTCRPCADRILDVLDQVLDLAATLDLVLAAGSAPRSGDGGRKRIKDQPVAPIPVSIAAAALTDVRSSRGTWVPDAPASAPAPVVDEHGDVVPVEQLRAQADAADRDLSRAVAVFGPSSDQARAAATGLDAARTRLRTALDTRPAAARSIAATDDDPASVVGFLDHWTDRVRVGRGLTGAGPCRAELRGPDGLLEMCGQPAEYRRLIRIDAGARTTGLFAVCSARHVTRPYGQGDRGFRHGQTVMTAIGLLRRHNEWICEQGFVADYWKGLKQLRADLGRAHGELRPAPIGNCPNGTGEVDEHGHEIACGQPLYASGYSDTIECTRCGRTWDHRQWRMLGRTLGVIA